MSTHETVGERGPLDEKGVRGVAYDDLDRDNPPIKMQKRTVATGTPCCFVGNIGHDGPCKNISFQKDTISKNGTVATEGGYLETRLRSFAVTRLHRDPKTGEVWTEPESQRDQDLLDAADEMERLRAIEQRAKECRNQQHGDRYGSLWVDTFDFILTGEKHG